MRSPQTSEAPFAYFRHGIRISMDGRGRCHDKIFVERLWWTVKHKWVYLRPCADGRAQNASLAVCFDLPRVNY